MGKLILSPPDDAAVARYTHTVAFYETDGMGIVHHSNHLRFLELARVAFMAEHDRPYTEYVAEGIHVPVIRAEVSYHQPLRFAERVVIACWLRWAKAASMGFAYRLEVEGQLRACALTDHAIVDASGQPRRIPAHMRERIDAWLGATRAP